MVPSSRCQRVLSWSLLLGRLAGCGGVALVSIR